MKSSNSDIRLLSQNESLISYFNEIIFGKYDDGELHNFLIINKNFENTLFLVTESNDEQTLSSFISNNITSNNLIREFIKIPDIVTDKQITYSPTNYSIIVLTITTDKNQIEINTLGLFEWILSNKLFNNKLSTLNPLELMNIIMLKEFELYALNYEDISKNFEKLMSDENLQEILNFEDM